MKTSTIKIFYSLPVSTERERELSAKQANLITDQYLPHLSFRVNAKPLKRASTKSIKFGRQMPQTMILFNYSLNLTFIKNSLQGHFSHSRTQKGRSHGAL